MDSDDEFIAGSRGEGAYGRPRSRDTSPIRKPIPYRPYVGVDKPTAYTTLPERTGTESARESRAQSPQARGRSPVRMTRSFREPRSASASPVRGLSSERLSRSYDSVTFERRKQRSSSSSPGRFGDGRRGILKNMTPASRARDRSSSPRYASRSHSPPTRLPPEDKDKAAAKKKLMFTRTESGQIARDIQREFDKEDSLLDDLRKKHSSKSWFELQL